MKSGIELIATERERQITEEGWTANHDKRLVYCELARAAVCYATPYARRCNLPAGMWPWDAEWWKPTPDDRICELVKAGALIAAEIDRIQNM